MKLSKVTDFNVLAKALESAEMKVGASGRKVEINFAGVKDKVSLNKVVSQMVEICKNPKNKGKFDEASFKTVVDRVKILHKDGEAQLKKSIGKRIVTAFARIPNLFGNIKKDIVGANSEAGIRKLKSDLMKLADALVATPVTTPSSKEKMNRILELKKQQPQHARRAGRSNPLRKGLANVDSSKISTKEKMGRMLELKKQLPQNSRRAGRSNPSRKELPNVVSSEISTKEKMDRMLKLKKQLPQNSRRADKFKKDHMFSKDDIDLRPNTKNKERRMSL